MYSIHCSTPATRDSICLPYRIRPIHPISLLSLSFSPSSILPFFSLNGISPSLVTTRHKAFAKANLIFLLWKFQDSKFKVYFSSFTRELLRESTKSPFCALAPRLTPHFGSFLGDQNRYFISIYIYSCGFCPFQTMLSKSRVKPLRSASFLEVRWWQIRPKRSKLDFTPFFGQKNTPFSDFLTSQKSGQKGSFI